MTDTKFGTSDFDSNLFQKILNRYIAYALWITGSKVQAADAYMQMVRDVYQRGSADAILSSSTQIDNNSCIFLKSELSQKKDKGTKYYIRFLLGLLDVSNNDEWQTELCQRCDTKSEKMWQVDHIVPQKLFTDLTSSKAEELQIGASVNSYKVICNTIANLRLLDSTKNMQHQNAKNDDHTYVLPTYEDLNKSLEKKCQEIYNSPFWDLLKS